MATQSNNANTVNTIDISNVRASNRFAKKKHFTLVGARSLYFLFDAAYLLADQYEL